MDTVNYYAFEFFNEHGDPRVAGYPLMATPWPVVGASLAYLMFVKLIGPALMRDRKPFELLTFIRVYNFGMVAWNLFAFVEACNLLNYGLETFGCRPIDPHARDPKSMKMISYAWLFLISRLVEFIDTICFVLRKKQRQISGFHVFHHFTVPIAVWMFVKFAPGGNSGIFPFLNSFIHTVMYAYYFLATYKSLQPYLGWKKYLTQIQIVQFVIMIMVSTQPLFIPGCKFPRTFLYINIFFSFVFIYLFTTFYIRTYGKQTVRVAKEVTRRISQQVRRLSQMHAPQTVTQTMSVDSQQSNNNRKDL
ncbi:Elongation of very long chain fatty acids protein 1, partial [Fragariocoptes setiger]